MEPHPSTLQLPKVNQHMYISTFSPLPSTLPSPFSPLPPLPSSPSPLFPPSPLPSSPPSPFYLPPPPLLVDYTLCFGSPGHTVILEWMLRNSLATGHEQDKFGSTPVHDSAENGQLDCLVVFHTYSVDLSPRDADGLLPR